MQVLSTGTRTTSWNGTVTHNVTLTWPDRNSARGFFNAGGSIRARASLTGYPTDGSKAKNDDWSKLLSDMGTISIKFGSVTNTGTSNVLYTGGFYSIPTSTTLIFQKGASTITYNPNQYDIYASLSSDQTALTLTISFKDLSLGNPNVDENVEGTLTSIVDAYYSTGPNVQSVLPSVLSTGP